MNLDDKVKINEKFEMEIILDPSKKKRRKQTLVLYKIDDENKELCWGVDWSVFLRSKRYFFFFFFI